MDEVVLFEAVSLFDDASPFDAESVFDGDDESVLGGVPLAVSAAGAVLPFFA
ncbi:MAG TPA: hypothetical protein VLL57_10750 [Candidatus Binataceae bacterium]|nr:hypothetical protein [Candidatus Binataceae bacterium]